MTINLESVKARLRSGPQLLAGMLISFLAIFLVTQLWYLYWETEKTKEVIRGISRTYDERIGEISGSSRLAPAVRQEELIKLSFLKEFKNQREWENSHERVNRRYSTFIALSEWFVALFLLWLTVLNEREGPRNTQADGEARRGAGVANLLVFFAALAIAFPAITQKLGFEVRQEIHDHRARQLGMLIVEVEAGATSSRQAWLRYQALFGGSVASYISRVNP